jgi:hypothetical protein
MNRLQRFSGVFALGARRSKRGLSVFQLIGCIAAIVAGVVVGATFLDIDLKAAWQLGLESAGVAPPHEGAPHGDPAGATADSATPSSEDPEAGSPADVTLAYWNRLRELINEEETTRTQGEANAAGDGRAMLYAQAKAFRQAAEAIGGMDAEGVDPEATALAEALEEWYEQAADLSDEGTRLDEGDLASSSGPLGRRWHSAKKQQSERLDLLTRKIVSVQGKLSARYRKTFPDLR